MSKGNLMIRMIDIVFILLFGFIAVSQISTAEELVPPKSSEAEESAPEGTEVLLVEVRNNGTYAISDRQMTFSRLAQLKAYLAGAAREARAKDVQLGVRIRASWDSPVEYGLQVAKACSELGIPKGLDVVKADGE